MTWHLTISLRRTAGVRPARAAFALVTQARRRRRMSQMSVVESAREQLLSSGSWSVDPAHSAIEFRVKHLVIQTVKGRFREFDGAIVAGAEPTISGSIRVASLDTFHEER